LTGADVRGSIVLTAAFFALMAEVEHVEQIADSRAVHRQVGIVSVGGGFGRLSRLAVTAAPATAVVSTERSLGSNDSPIAANCLSANTTELRRRRLRRPAGLDSIFPPG
jgi:hypothetical protein